jgi:asparagine synthase (glutamine-hydrolysing)
MCGVAGVFNHRSREPARAADLAAMGRRLAHRGPDGDGVYLDGALGLAHRRLAILDREGGRQPMESAGGAVVIAYNGEVYNYRDVFAALEGRGRAPRTRCDTEAVILAYEAWGLEFVDRLRGMFALALWDRPRRRLVLARDRLGIKPLYWAETPGGLVFASEPKALWGAPGVDHGVDLDALDEYMSLGYVVTPRSMARGLRKLAPGTTLAVEEGGAPSCRRYWSVRFDPDPAPSAAAWASEVRALFDDVTRLHLQSDVPVGVLLSGGIDSSIVASSVAAQTSRVETFTIGVDVPGSMSELGWARRVAAAAGARHHERRLGDDDHTALLREVAAIVDEPIAEPVCAQLLGVCRLARDAGVVVVLSGEGADEIFFGYGMYPKMALVSRAQRLVPPAALSGAVAPALRLAARALARAPKLAKYLNLAGEPLERRYLGVNLFDPALKARLYHPDAAAALAGRDAGLALARLYDGAGGPEPMAQMAAFDCRAWLVDDILLRADLMSMAASIELRVPFLDHRLVELAQRIPSRHKVRGATGKVVLRRAFADRVLPDVIRRPKLGFPTPIREIFRGRFGREAEDLLTAPSAATASLFDRAAVRALFAEHRAGPDQSRTLYQIYALEAWARAAARGAADARREAAQRA